MPESKLPTVTLYSRENCHLCELAEEKLKHLNFKFEVVNIAGNADLEAHYGHDVPVLVWGEKLLLKGVFSRERLSGVKAVLLRLVG